MDVDYAAGVCTHVETLLDHIFVGNEVRVFDRRSHVIPVVSQILPGDWIPEGVHISPVV